MAKSTIKKVAFLGGEMGVNYNTKSTFENKPIIEEPKEGVLNRWKFEVNGKTKYLFALDRNQAERKAKKNKWIK